MYLKMPKTIIKFEKQNISKEKKNTGIYFILYDFSEFHAQGTHFIGGAR